MVKGAFWNIRYHEQRLSKAIQKLAFAEELLKRTGIDYDVFNEPERTDDGDPLFTSFEQIALRRTR